MGPPPLPFFYESLDSLILIDNILLLYNFHSALPPPSFILHALPPPPSLILHATPMQATRIATQDAR